MMRGMIIGGGIGGLSTAIALQQAGMVVRVYEKQPGDQMPGTGILLAVNALRTLDKMGLADAVCTHGNELNGLNITNERLLPLSKNNLPYFLQKYGYSSVALHRADLERILHDALIDDTVELDKHCTRVTLKDRQVISRFEDGTSADGDYLLAADGIHSVVRKQLFPDVAARGTGQLCWRGLLEFELPVKYQRHAIEAWGKGKRFGFVPVRSDTVYWYATLNKHNNEFDYGANLTDELARQFSQFAPLISQLISGTLPEKIIRSELMDIGPVPRWFQDRICLMGDAAHAMTPDLGQGACQAIEDAWAMASLLKESKNPAIAFPAFQKKRKPRTDYVTRLSRRVGQMAHYESGLLVGLRNQLMKTLPPALTKRQFEKIFAPDDAL
jgi:2-polyprenyl-6-methoxyphenol hydroxylase-like FAD-dependent oxidoreductase